MSHQKTETEAFLDETFLALFSDESFALSRVPSTSDPFILDEFSLFRTESWDFSSLSRPLSPRPSCETALDICTVNRLCLAVELNSVFSEKKLKLKKQGSQSKSGEKLDGLLQKQFDFQTLSELTPNLEVQTSNNKALCVVKSEPSETDGEIFTRLLKPVRRSPMSTVLKVPTLDRGGQLRDEWKLRRERCRLRLQEKRRKWKAEAEAGKAKGHYPERAAAALARKRIGGRFQDESKGRFVPVTDLER